MPNRLFAAPVLCVLLLVAGPVAAKMYKWIDEEGNVQYSQVPPPDRAVQVIAPAASVTAPDMPEPEQSAQGEDEAKKKDPRAEKAKAEENRRNCEIARKNLQLLQNARRVMDEGQLVILDETNRSQRVEGAQKQVDRFCNQ